MIGRFSAGLFLLLLMLGFTWLAACGPEAVAGPVTIERDTTILIVDDSVSRAKLDSLTALLDSLLNLETKVDTVWIACWPWSWDPHCPKPHKPKQP